MIIALDYDDTVTKDPEFFQELIDLAQYCGHKVIIVTNNLARYRPDIIEFAAEHKCPVLFAAEHPKGWFVKSQGYHVDVWIDDCPEAIVGLGV